ncbi:alpha/beta hydrolase [Paenibacillus sp. CC-CFT747]|nr:alpha/beta hydrolase [Paenibacillus sp. CC-CFT747]
MLDFQRRYTCYFPDFRGHGRTRCSSLEWNTPQLADDMVEWMNRMHLEKVHLIGYSLGALDCIWPSIILSEFLPLRQSGPADFVIQPGWRSLSRIGLSSRASRK